VVARHCPGRTHDPELVETIVSALVGSDRRDAFLDHVEQYSGDAAVGYDHRVHHRSQRYPTPG